MRIPRGSLFHVLLLSPLLLSRPVSVATPAECDVRRLLKVLDVPPGSVVLTQTGEAEEVDLLLVPAAVDAGKYQVTVTRKAKDLYRVDAGALYLQTSYCYEYAFGESAILDLQTISGFTLGKIIFNP